MAIQSEQTNTQSKNASRRQERAHRILDAAAASILRWGYDKTTIDDIARHAGVAKGTIYLHWKTREELFLALLRRENLEWLKDFKQRIEQDPSGFMLRGVLKHSALSLVKRPLLKALLFRDMEVIGKLAHSQQSSAAAVEKLAGFNTYLQFLREHNLVRTDLSLQAQVYMLAAIFMGHFLVAPWMPDECVLSDEELAGLIGETVHRTLESDRPVSAGESQAVSQVFTGYLNRYIAVVQEQLGQALE